MKRRFLLCILVCVCLPVAALAAAPAQPYTQLTISEDENYLWSLAAYDGTLYLLRDNGMYRLSGGEKEETKLTMDWTKEPSTAEGAAEIHQLLSASDGLYGLNQLTKTIYRCVLRGTTVMPQRVCTLPDTFYGRIRNAFIADGFFVCDMGENIQAFHIATGEITTQSAFSIKLMAAYREGYYITLESKTDVNGTIQLIFMAVNLATGEKENVGTIHERVNMQAMAYDRDSDILYFASSGQMYAWQDGSAHEVAAFPRGDVMGLSLINQDFAAVCSDGVFVAIRSLHQGQATESAAKRIVIQEKFGRGSVYSSFIKQHSDIDLQFAKEPATTVEDQFIQDMLCQSAAVDIYVLTEQRLLSIVKEKQYGADLSKSETLRQKTAEMFPYMQNAISDKGRIYAMPREIYLPALAYNKEIFAELHMPVPTTYQAYFEFCIHWLQDDADAYPDYTLNPFLEDLEPVTLLRLYADERAHNGLPLVFASDSLRATLDAYMRLKSAAANLEVDSNGTSLFSLVYIPYEGEYDVMPLTFEAGNQATVSPGKEECYYFVVNPYSKNQDQAITFLETWLTTLSPQENLVLFTTTNTAVENPEYHEILQRNEDKIQAAEKKKADAEPIEAQALADTIALLKADRAWSQEHERWLISPTELALRDRDIASAYLETMNPIPLIENGNPTFFRLYLTTPPLDIDAFLHRVDELAKQIAIENQ